MINKLINKIQSLLKIGEPQTLEEYIKSRISNGDSKEKIQEELLKDLEEGGRIFGEFKNALKPTFAGSVNRFRDVGALAKMGISGKYVWSICEGKRDPVCPDCLERNKQSKTWEEWEKIGLPRTGKTICKKNCKCVLLPEEIIKLTPVYKKEDL